MVLSELVGEDRSEVKHCMMMGAVCDLHQNSWLWKQIPGYDFDISLPIHGVGSARSLA